MGDRPSVITAAARSRAAPFAVIYTRVSSEEQVAGTSLGTQLEACRQCAARLGLSVLSEHEDAGKSARSTVGRDALAAAMDAAAKSKAALIVYKFDRLSRNLGDGYDLRDILIAKGCRIISASEGEASATPVSKAMYAMMMAFAELDNDMRTERCHAGMVARAMAGAWVSNAPIGFRAVRDAAGAPVLVPDGDKSEILRAAFLDFVAGSIDKAGLTARLKRQGWPDSTVSRIIRSPVYGGIVRNNLTGGEDVPAAFPGLVTADQWYILEARMRHGKRVTLKDNPAFPYTSTIFCSLCGLPVRSGFAKSRGNAFGYYFCGKAGHPKAKRENVHTQVAWMLAQIGTMTEYLELLKRSVAAVEVDDPERKERDRHRRAVSRIEPQLAKLRGALLDGTFSREEYDAENVRLRAALAESKAWLAEHDAAADLRSKAMDVLIRVFTDPEAAIAKLQVPQIKDLIRIMFGKFTLTAEKQIEPAQTSAYVELMSAKAAHLKSGRGGGGKFEPGSVVFEALWVAAERMAALLKSA